MQTTERREECRFAADLVVVFSFLSFLISPFYQSSRNRCYVKYDLT